MRIVHYTLGLYPNRTGGLNRYATDLIKEQAKEHVVTVLMPGKWNPFFCKCWISKWKIYGDVQCYYLNNSLPQPLLLGIKKPQDFISCNISENSFKKFYNDVRPEIIHLHTLMGMPEDALLFFKEKGVKIVYSSHDYFGICPMVNLINQNEILCEGPTPERCLLCNINAPSTLYLRLRSSNFVFFIRDILEWLKNTLNF